MILVVSIKWLLRKPPLTTPYLQSWAVCRVDDVDEDVRILEVVTPVRTDGTLTSYVPHVQEDAWKNITQYCM